MKKFQIHIGQICVMLLCASMFSSIWAAVPPWPVSRYSYFADKPATLSKVLTDFAKQFGTHVKVDGSVQGMVSGRIHAGSPRAFLDQLAASHGFSWYYYQGIVYVSDAQKQIQKAIQIPQGNMQNLRQALNSMGLLEERFGWGELPDQGLLMISGPASYVQRVEKALAQIPPTALAGQKIQVFNLKHIPVDRRTFTYRNQQMTIPGAADILRTVIAGGDPGTLGTQTQVLEAAAPLRLRAKEQKMQEGTPRSGNQTSSGETTNRPTSRLSGNRATPVIESDPRLNAVIIRDTPEMMPVYERLIALLDQPTALIEIEALIVDITSDKMNELGIDWRYNGSNKGEVGFGQNGNFNTPSILSAAAGTPSVLAAVQINNFLSRIRALETSKDATIVSRPSILTISNQAAVMDLSQTYYVPLQGQNVNDLAEITAGTLLKVTPRLVSRVNDRNRQIEVFVDIEDGEVSTARDGGTNLPNVSRRTINTQAVLGENTSLLIAGHRTKRNITTDNSVPVLGKLPVLGRLFRSSTKDQKSFDRLFMITPRIVSIPPAGSDGDARRSMPTKKLEGLTNVSPSEREAIRRQYKQAAPVYRLPNPVP